MIFEFGSWAIEGYQYGWMVIRRTAIKSGKSEGQEVADRRTYYETLEGAFRALPEKVLREHDGYGVVAAIQAVQALGGEYARELDRKRIRGKAA